MQLSEAVVILPTYNEVENLQPFIEQLLEQARKIPNWKVCILVVDSGSSDGTFELAQQLEKENSQIYTLCVGKGLGVALIEGHTYALEKLKPNALVQLDADGQVDAEILPRLIGALDEGYDLVLGSRFIKGGKNELSLIRRLFSFGSCLVFRVVMGPWQVSDFGNSARAFTPELFRKMDLDRIPWRHQTYIFLPAFLNEALQTGAKWKQVPLVFKKRLLGRSKNAIFRYGWDVITYSVGVRLSKCGLNFPFFEFFHSPFQKH